MNSKIIFYISTIILLFSFDAYTAHISDLIGKNKNAANLIAESSKTLTDDQSESYTPQVQTERLSNLIDTFSNSIQTLGILKNLLHEYNISDSTFNEILPKIDNISYIEAKKLCKLVKRISICLYPQSKNNKVNLYVLIIALYKAQNKRCYSEKDLCIVLTYILKLSNINQNEILNICCNYEILEGLVGLRLSDISRIISKAQNLSLLRNKNSYENILLYTIKSTNIDRRSNLNSNQEERPLNLIQTYDCLSYSLNKEGIILSSDDLFQLSMSAADSFSESELRFIVNLTKEIIDFYSLDGKDALCLALFRLLDIKSEPYCVTEVLKTTKSTNSKGAFDVSAGHTHNFYKEFKNFYFSINKNILKNASEYKASSYYGDDIIISRLEYCNKQNPDIQIIKVIMQYYLKINGMHVSKSMENITNSIHFLVSISFAKISCSTIRDLIKLVCLYAKQNNTIICTAEHYRKALFASGFNTELYSYTDDSQISDLVKSEIIKISELKDKSIIKAIEEASSSNQSKAIDSNNVAESQSKCIIM